MQDLTKHKFSAYIQQLTQRYNGAGLGQKFSYDITAQQAFVDLLGDSSAFLKSVNHQAVGAQIGDRLSVSDGMPLGSTQDTEEGERVPRGTDVEGVQYVAVQTNFDSFLKYSQLDSWAHLSNFDQVYANYIVQAVAKSLTMIAFNGETHAKTSDIATYPLLQDCGLGWLAFAKKWQPQQILGLEDDGSSNGTQYQLGTGGDYETLDGLVFDLIASRFEPWHVEADDLVVLVGRELWVSHGMGLMKGSNVPSEVNALKVWLGDKTIAGYPCMMPPYMPARGLMVTSLKNLSVYHQVTSLRRTIMNNAKRDRIEEYLSENIAFVVEDFGKFAAVRNDALLLKNKLDQWV